MKEEWERARKAEAEENQRLYDEWLRQEVSAVSKILCVCVCVSCVTAIADGNRTLCSGGTVQHDSCVFFMGALERIRSLNG